MATVLTHIARQQAKLAAGDARAAAPLVTAWTQTLARLNAQLGPLAAAGPSAKRDRVATLIAQADAELHRNAVQAASVTSVAAKKAAVAAQLDSAALLAAVLPGTAHDEFASVDTAAVNAITAAAGRGPLRRLLDVRAGQASAQVRQALTDALVQGTSPRTTARALNAAVGGQLANALTVARTEQLRAYRETQRATYDANRDVVSGWVWADSNQRSTCAFCLAMRGRRFPLGAPMHTHPNCRCTQVPVVPGYDAVELGSGEQAFAALPVAEQQKVVGVAGLAAMRAGRLTLADFAETGKSAQWGPWGRKRSLVQALAHAGETPRTYLSPTAVSRARAAQGVAAGARAAAASTSGAVGAVVATAALPFQAQRIVARALANGGRPSAADAAYWALYFADQYGPLAARLV